MTEHLPDCFLSEPWNATTNPHICICERLRACEQRVLEGPVVANYAYLQRIHECGRMDALDAAREAVAGLRSAIFNTATGPAVWREDAIAAIDGLKEKP